MGGFCVQLCMQILNVLLSSIAHSGFTQLPLGQNCCFCSIAELWQENLRGLLAAIRAATCNHRLVRIAEFSWPWGPVKITDQLFDLGMSQPALSQQAKASLEGKSEKSKTKVEGVEMSGQNLSRSRTCKLRYTKRQSMTKSCRTL